MKIDVGVKIGRARLPISSSTSRDEASIHPLGTAKRFERALAKSVIRIPVRPQWNSFTACRYRFGQT